MRPDIRASSLIWLLYSFTFLHLSSSHVLEARYLDALQSRAKAADIPGFGIELETRTVHMLNNKISKQRSSEQDMKKLKGAVMGGETFAKHDDQWQLTAEQYSDTIRDILPEFIVNGLTVGLGNGNVKSAVEDIIKYMDCWQPAADASCKSMKVAGFGEQTWDIVDPQNYKAELVLWSIQITTSMPLDAIEDLIKEARDSNTPTYRKNALLGLKHRNMHWVQSTHFAVDGNRDGKDSKYPENFARADATAEVRGFLSLLLTYAKGTSKYDPNTESPKMISSIMPRTNFVGMFSQVKEQMNLCQEGDLFKLVNSLAQFRGDDSNDRDITRNLAQDKFKIRDYNDQMHEVNVKAWIDGIEQNIDRLALADGLYADNQIGKLGLRLEGVLGSGRKAPIFEFRDIAGPSVASGAGIESSGTYGLLKRIKDLEDAAVALHKAHRVPNKRDTISLLDARANEPKKKQCPRCKAGEATTGKNGACEKCPSGKRPSEDQSKCINEKKCKEGEAQIARGRACQKCPWGKVPSENEQSCVDDRKCNEDEGRLGSTGTCAKCPAGQVLTANKQSCEDMKCKPGEVLMAGKCQNCPGNKIPASNGKSCVDRKDDKDNDKKKARRKFCLGLFASSGLIEGAEVLRTAEGISTLEEAADDISTGKYDNLDLVLTDSNMDLDQDRASKVPDRWLLGQADKRDTVEARGINVLFTIGVKLGQIFAQLTKNVLRLSRLAFDAVKNLGRTLLKVGGENRTGRPAEGVMNSLSKLSKEQRVQKAKDGLRRITDHDKFDMCLSAAIPLAGMEIAQAWMHIDGVPKGGFKAVDDAMAIFLFDNHDDAKRKDVRESFGPSNYWMTYNDELWHHNRLIPETCQSAADLAGKVSAYAVLGGCCAFYSDDNCKVPMWTATDREDGNLQGPGNDATRSWSCTKDRSCKPLPNLNGFQQGQCGMHVVQYQRSGSNPIAFAAKIVDAKGFDIMTQERRDATNDILKIDVPKLGKELKFDITPATRGNPANDADNHVLISIGQDSFWSNSTRCKFGAYSGKKGKPGDRSGDCGFAC